MSHKLQRWYGKWWDNYCDIPRGKADKDRCWTMSHMPVVCESSQAHTGGIPGKLRVKSWV